MDDSLKTKEELIEEVKTLRSRIGTDDQPPSEKSTQPDTAPAYVEALKRELEQVRQSETEKIREIERLAAQESTCNSIMIFLQEMGQQLENFSEQFKAIPGPAAFKEMIDHAVKQTIQPDAGQAQQPAVPLSPTGNNVLEKLNDIQFQFENFIAQSAKLGGASPPPEDENVIQIMDLKIDRIIQQLDYLQQDYQDFKFTSSNTAASSDASEEMQSIEEKLKHLNNEFQSKIKIDQKKDILIDNLHKELQDYKNDIQKKFLQSIVMDIIQIIDNIRRLTRHYHQDPANNDPDKLLKLLENIPTDLEDLFYMQGISPFTCETTTFDGTRQRVLKKIETSDQSKDKQVSESLRPGYEWDDKILRPEMVAAYVYKEPEPPEAPADNQDAGRNPEETHEAPVEETGGVSVKDETNETTNNETDR